MRKIANPRVGIDIVYIPKFSRSIEKQGEPFLSKIFLETELASGDNPGHLAGIFAAKEAAVKALSIPSGNWLKIFVSREKSGRPKIQLLDEKYNIKNYDLSISHDGDYAIAIFMAYL